ncbi:Gibberellin 2-beta-dioxygenase 8, partial [Cucurbita argyrosperma subsp. argyrosperma]|uniref:Gibberellin 2-beta-dioxygenase 8-like n=2 Tax=Cucurbita TaxID=3660 RepID=A0A6J1F0S8_CUCMO
MSMEIEPPLHVRYYALMKEESESKNGRWVGEEEEREVVEECEEEEELPVIDLGLLKMGNSEREKCISEMVEAARNWGFFQVLNHGVPERVLKGMMYEQKKVFNQPFAKKSLSNVLNLAGTYRWGNPVAMSPSQISWSEAFHMAVLEVSNLEEHVTLRPTMEAVVKKFGRLAESIAEILGQSLGIKACYFKERCEKGRSSFRLNRYPPCPFASQVYGLIPHTDSDYLTILYQAQVSGLQLMKDGKWFAVKPNPKALLVNIGDLFQVVSNDAFRSLKHRVVASEAVERFSFAYFYSPSDDVMIESCTKPSIYRQFSYREYRQQIEKDVEKTGNKVGLPRFFLHNMLPHLGQ